MYCQIYGDSITQGAWDSEGGWPNRILQHFNKRAIDDGYRDDRHFVFPLGVTDSVAKDLVARLDSEVPVRLSETHNNVAVFAIGVNDSSIFHDGAQDRFHVSLEEFEENYEALLQKAKGFTLQTICVGLSPCDDNKAKRPYWAPDASWNNDRMQKFNRVASKVAKNNGVEFVEIFEVLQSANEEHELFPDGLHPNGIGHELIAATVLPVLEKYAN